MSQRQPLNRFAIYDLPSNQREALTVFDAAERGDVKVLTKLSKMKGFDVNSKDKFGRTALMWAADCGQVRPRRPPSPSSREARAVRGSAPSHSVPHVGGAAGRLAADRSIGARACDGRVGLTSPRPSPRVSRTG